MAKNGEIVFHGIVVLLLFAGLYDVLLNVEENECEMSHMYELPQYKKIPMSEDVAEEYPRYGLYLYGEGHYFKVVSDLQLEGIPVLYIPGNGGSKKQSRSVGSFLLRKAEKIGWDPHFNVFTVDLNEELIAFYGGTLNDQIEYVHHCIKAILKIYQDSSRSINKPQSVVLIGHSMGGMVARGVFTSPGFDPNLVKVIYTLATPHVHPVFSIDMHIAQFYKSVNSYWEDNCEELKDITLISISGGDRDFQVHGASTRLPICLNNSISTSSTAVPRAWVSADHQCAVWCKQVVLATTRSLNDMVDQTTKQISDDASIRYDSVNYHFKHNPGLTKYPDNGLGNNKVKLLKSHEVVAVSESFWSSSYREIGAEPAYYMFNLVDMKKNRKVLAVARTTSKSDRWMLACNKEDCKSATDISKMAYLTPDFKVAKLNITELIQNDFTQLLVKVPKQTKYNGEVDVNFLTDEDLNQEYTVPNIFSNLWTFDQGYRMNISIGTKARKFYHKIQLSGLHSIYHAYKFTLHSIQKGKHMPLLEVQLPEKSSYTYAKHGNVTVKLQNTAGTNVPILHIYTDGSSEYVINAKVQFVQLLGQILRFNGAIIPTMIALNGMLAFSYQLKMLLAGKPFLTTVAAHGISAKPYKVQPFINLVKAFYGYEGFMLVWHKFGLPVPDAVRLDNEFRIWFGLLPLVMFLFGAEVFSISIYLQKKLILSFGALYRRFFTVNTAKDLEYGVIKSATHAVILTIFATQCGGLALSYICLLNFVDLSALSSILPPQKNLVKPEKNGNAKTEDVKEKSAATTDEKPEQNGSNNTEKEEKDIETEMDDTTINFNIKLSMHQLWLILTLLSAPSVIARFKGYSFQAGDPTLAFAVFGSFLFLLHKQGNAVVYLSISRKIICRLLYPLTILTSMLCLHSIHRLPYFILSFMSFYVAMQFFG